MEQGTSLSGTSDHRKVPSLYHGQKSASRAVVVSVCYMCKSRLCRKNDDNLVCFSVFFVVVFVFFLTDSMGDFVRCYGGGIIYYP